MTKTRKQIFENQGGCFKHGWLPGFGNIHVQKLTEGCPACLIISLTTEVEDANDKIEALTEELEQYLQDKEQAEAEVKEWREHSREVGTALHNSEKSVSRVCLENRNLRADKEAMRNLLRECEVKFLDYAHGGYIKMPSNLMKRIQQALKEKTQ